MSSRSNARPSPDHDEFSIGSRRDEQYSVLYRPDALNEHESTLASVLRERPSIFVMTPTVERLYGARLRAYLAANGRTSGVSFLTIACSESSKGMDQVLQVCEHAASAGLERRSQIVAFGGGVAMDICGVAASLFRRGIQLVRIPTTLIGIIDAGIGVKNGINFAGKKSLLGTFSAPEACLLDPRFLRSLPSRHIRCGLAESLKMALIRSAPLFALLEEHGPALVRSAFQSPPEVAESVIKLSVEGMLDELSTNLFEKAYARKVDFGHTFSPYIEERSGHEIAHGEAVAMDIALSAQIAWRLGLLMDDDLRRIHSTLQRLDLPLCWNGTNAGELRRSLKTVVDHRDGRLNLVVPTGLGTCTFLPHLEEVTPTLLEECVSALVGFQDLRVAE